MEDEHEIAKAECRSEIQKRANLLIKFMNHDVDSECPMLLILDQLARIAAAISKLESARSNQRHQQEKAQEADEDSHGPEWN